MPRSPKFWIILLGILALAGVTYFTGAKRVPLWDRDEPWYAQCTREMLQSGDWVVPTYLKELRIEKPPAIYWCQLAVMKKFGDTAQSARFPSSAAVLLTIILVALTVRRYTGDKRALWTVFILGTSGIAIASAKFCITDGVMLLFMMIGQACLAALYWASRKGRTPRWWIAPIFWISLGLAGITKGPQPLGEHLFTLLILLVQDVLNEPKGQRKASWGKHIRWWRFLQPLAGIPILVAVVDPWLILIHDRSPGFITAVFDKARMHLSQSMEGHGKPPGYHALLMFGTFFPWSLLLPTTLVSWYRNRRFAVIRFAFAAAAGPWLMMELVYTKLPFYVLPAFPGLSFLMADMLVRCLRKQYRDFAHPFFKAMIVAWIIAAVGLSTCVWFSFLAAKGSGLPIFGFIVFTLVGLGYTFFVSREFFRQQFVRAVVGMGVGMCIMLLILYTLVLPNMTFLHLPERLATDLTNLGAAGKDVHVLMIGYDEPSMAFYQGGGARRPPSQGAYFEITPPQQWPRWFVISDDKDDWQRIPPALKTNLAIRATESGLNYSHEGKTEKVLVVENTAAKN